MEDANTLIKKLVKVQKGKLMMKRQTDVLVFDSINGGYLSPSSLLTPQINHTQNCPKQSLRHRSPHIYIYAYAHMYTTHTSTGELYKLFSLTKYVKPQVKYDDLTSKHM